MGHFKIRLLAESNFVAEIYFCYWNTAAKSKQFDLAAVLQHHFFMLQTAKIVLKPRGTTWTFFLALATQHIALQAQ